MAGFFPPPGDDGDGGGASSSLLPPAAADCRPPRRRFLAFSPFSPASASLPAPAAAPRGRLRALPLRW